MSDFLLGMEYNLETTLLALVLGFIVAAGLVWSIMAARCRTRLAQLTTKLEKEITASEHQRMQLGTDLNNLQQKIQQTELKVTEQTALLAQLEKEKQAAQTEAERASTLESSVNQQKQELAQLKQQLQESEKSRTELQQIQQSWQGRLDEKEAVIVSLTSTVDEQVTQLKELEQNISQQQAQFTQTQQANIDLQQQLNDTALQLQESKQQLTDVSLQLQQAQQQLSEQTKLAVMAEPVETGELQQTIIELQENCQALEEKLLASESAVSALNAAQFQTDLATADSELVKKLSRQDAEIASLNATLAEQANYLFRLEYDLEVKKALLNNHSVALQGIPAAIVAKQEEAQARIAELERLLNPKQKSAKKISEKNLSNPSELLNPAKQQLEEITDKVKHLPERFKSFYQKILAKKP